MANRYKNAQFDLTTTNATDVYTVPSQSRAIIQNIHVANVGSGNTEIKLLYMIPLQVELINLQNIQLIQVILNLYLMVQLY